MSTADYDKLCGYISGRVKEAPLLPKERSNNYL